MNKRVKVFFFFVGLMILVLLFAACENLEDFLQNEKTDTTPLPVNPLSSDNDPSDIAKEDPLEGLTYIYVEETDSYNIFLPTYEYAAEVIIPEMYEGKPVTGVIHSQFDNERYDQMTKLTIPKTVTLLCLATGKNFEKLDYQGTLEDWCNIEFTRTVSMEGRSFSEFLGSLIITEPEQEVLFQSFITGELYIDGSLVDGNDLVIPKGVSEIKQRAFAGRNIKLLDIPENVSIHEEAFMLCSIDTLHIKKGMKLGYSSFSRSIIGELEMLDGSSQSSSPFYSTIIRHFKIDSKAIVTYIEYLAGSYILKVEDKRSDKGSYMDELFGPFAPTPDVYGCTIVEYIDNVEDSKAFVEGDFEFYESKENLIMYYGTEENVVIPQGVKTIFPAFMNNRTAKQIVIPDSVEKIQNNAFQYSTALTSIVIPNGVTEIGSSAFYGCSSLSSISLSSGLKKIERRTFEFTGLKSLEIPNGVTEIEAYAFLNDHYLTSITIPDSVLRLGEEAFAQCYNLTTVYLSEGLTKIEEGVFNWSDKIKYNEYGNALYLGSKNNPYFALIKPKGVDANEFTIHTSTKVIADYALQNRELTAITIPSSVTHIGVGAFYACTDLSSVIFAEESHLIDIGYAAFEHNALSSIALPNNLESIGSYAFAYNSLQSIHYGGTIAQWNAIKKERSWNEQAGEYTVYCLDGEINRTVRRG